MLISAGLIGCRLQKQLKSRDFKIILLFLNGNTHSPDGVFCGPGREIDWVVQGAVRLMNFTFSICVEQEMHGS